MISGALAILKSEAQRNEMSAIYEKNKSLFLSIAYKKLQNNENAEDAVQEAFLEISDKPDTFFALNEKDAVYVCGSEKHIRRYVKQKYKASDGRAF